MKRQQIESKLDQLRHLVGDEGAFKDVDIDGDFDPVEHDKIMQVGILGLGLGLVCHSSNIPH